MHDIYCSGQELPEETQGINIYTVSSLGGLCTEAFSKKMLYGKLLCACTQTRHLQPLCPGTPIAASWYYCHGNTFICLTKLEMGKWNP